MVSVARMERPARAVHSVTAAPGKVTVARIPTVMLDARPSLVRAMLRQTYLPMAFVARTERLAREALSVIVAPRKGTAEKTVTVVQVAKLLLAPARRTLALSQLTVVAEASMARLAKAARSVTVAPLVTGVVKRRITAMQAVSLISVPVTPRLATFLPMAFAVRTARPAREAPTVTAVLLRATAVRQAIARLAVSLSSVLAMKLPVTSRPMEAVARMARPARAVPLAIVAPSMATVGRATPSAAMVARRLLVFALASLLTLSAVPGTARLVLALVSETAARRMASVEAALLTVVKAAKKALLVLV